MFFINKTKLDEYVKDQIAKSSHALIDDMPDHKKQYRDREISISYEDMWKMYLRNEWIRACVDKITKAVTSTKLYAVARNESDVESPQVKEHIQTIQNLIDDPNTGLESFSDIRREILRDILIYDAGAMEIVYDDKGEVAELYSLSGSRVRLIVDEHGNFYDENQAYFLKPYDEFKQKPVIFARNELIYFVSNPKSGSVYGLSPLESLYYAVLNDLNASKYNSDFFSNNAEASGILGLEGLNWTEMLKFKNYWKREIEGKSHKVAMVNGRPTWTPMNMSNRDMQFLEYQRWLLCKIMAVYGMQPVVLGVIDPTTGKLNSAEQMEAFKNDTLKPLLSMECYQLTKVLVQQGFGFDDVIIESESVDITDEVSSTSIAVNLVGSGIITVNEARKMYFGLDPIEGGDAVQGSEPPPMTPSPTNNTPADTTIQDNFQIPAGDDIWVEESPISVTDEVTKMVVQRGTKWCVVHAHPKVPGSTADRAPGTPIKCYSGPDAKRRAEAMHRAIQISQAKEAGEFKSKRSIRTRTIIKRQDNTTT